MKVGIVTIYDFFNHGNRLQNYALQTTLQKSGNDVETLAITPKKAYAVFNKFSKLFLFVPVLSRMNKSKKSTAKILKTTYLDFYSAKKLKALNQKFDAFVLGSDQVWNPCYIANKAVSFLNFAPEQKTIAYAPSFGVENLPQSELKDFEAGLSHIKFLSVREEQGAQIVQKIAHRNAEIVTDPVFLLSKQEWQEFAQPVKNMPENFVLTYFLGNNKKAKSVVKSLAEKENLQVININDPSDKFYKATPQQFVYLLLHARFVCTNSFHGHAMSIVLEKQFISFSSLKNTNSRISHLLSTYDLQNRNYKLYTNEKIDYCTVTKKVEGERKKSLDFLKNALKNVEKSNDNS